MALVPSRYFYYPTTTNTTTLFFQSRFHETPFIILNKTPSIRLKALNFCSNNSNFNFEKNPHENTWLQFWNKPYLQNRPKTPISALNYRNDSVSVVDGDSGGTMNKIVDKLKKSGYIDDDIRKNGVKVKTERIIGKGSVEDIFYVEEGIFPDARGGFSEESPFDDKNLKFPWEKKKKVEGNVDGAKWTAKKKSRTSLAELTLPENELRRLINLTFRTNSKTKVKGAGVTQAVVDAIHEKWKTSEITRVKVEGAPALNMKRMHEILERKTGGLVIWRSATAVSLYRGVSYEAPEVQYNKRLSRVSPRSLPDKTINDPVKFASDNNANSPNRQKNSDTECSGPVEEVNYDDEIDWLLNSLGPRYTEWPGCEPQPVDADMLPGIVPGYQSPFRVLPYGVRKNLGANETTALRRLARVLPPHFAIGRGRQLQGLAAAMVKLWEKSSIAKVALKRGVMLTTSERMAEEIKRLTGGILLSRNKDFLVFYRGKDFLSPDVSEALLERERLTKSLQDEEEQARLRASAFLGPSVNTSEQAGTAGTLGETLDADARWGKTLDDSHKQRVIKEAEVMSHANLVRKLERKLLFAERKVMRAERALAKVEVFLKPAENRADPESITEEERFMFRKLGLRMKAFLLLGRRGVFDGTVENMHLHWKYRELVKIHVKSKSYEQVKKVALALEAESGGVLVSVDKISKGYAVIVYRGNDYRRPSMIRPRNLLTKRKALARSIELQRQEALLKYISNLQTKVDKLRVELEQMDVVKDQGVEELYNRLDSAYPTDDDSEDEEDDAYLETNDIERDDEDEHDDSIRNSQDMEFPNNSQNQSDIESFDDQLDSDFPTDDEQTEDEGDESNFETYNSKDESDNF